MGIRFYCPNGHKLNVKEFQAGLKGICPYCGTKIQIPTESTRSSSKEGAAVPDKAGRGPPFQGESAPVADEMPAATADFQSLPIVASGEPFDQAPLATPTTEPISLAQTAAAQSPLAQPAADAAEPADPLTEAGDVVWYVRPPSGGQFGPAGADAMRSWIDEGRVSADCLVWREGWRDWREASQVFPTLGAGGAEPPLMGISAGATSTVPVPVRDGPAYPRRKSSSSQAVIIILLVFAVVILSGVFVYVLSRDL